jgi:hypothetical protein
MIKQKSELTALGVVPEAIVNFVFDENRGEKVFNNEGMNVGDVIKLEGYPEEISEGNFGGGQRQWVSIMTTGTRTSVSLSRLVGTQNKTYFAIARKEEMFKGKPCLEVAEGIDIEKVIADKQYLSLPARERDAVAEVTKYFGKSVKLIAIARNCGRFESEFSLFQVID